MRLSHRLYTGFYDYMESATEIHYDKSSEYQDQSYLRKDHNVFMNDWYSGNIIFKELCVNSRDACGNMR